MSKLSSDQGVLPRDAAEAMRFFNRRQLGKGLHYGYSCFLLELSKATGKEVMSQMVSEIFGADIEFQNAKPGPPGFA